MGFPNKIPVMIGGQIMPFTKGDPDITIIGVGKHSQHRIIELEKEKLEMQMLTDKKIHELEKTSFQMMKKYYLTIAIAGLAFGGFMGAFTFYENNMEKDYVMLVGESAKSKYLVQNLRGDTMQTWFPWMIAGSQTLYVNILDNNLATQEKIDVIKKLLSQKKFWRLIIRLIIMVQMEIHLHITKVGLVHYK